MKMSQSAAAGHAVGSSLVWRVIGLLGCLAVVAIHVIDQGGVPGTKNPDYVQTFYYALEIGGVVGAALLLTRYLTLAWFLTLGIAVGPILGYALSRGPGLPNYTDDIGNWAEPLGIVSLLVEGLLLILAATCLLRTLQRAAQPPVAS